MMSQCPHLGCTQLVPHVHPEITPVAPGLDRELVARLRAMRGGSTNVAQEEFLRRAPGGGTVFVKPVSEE